MTIDGHMACISAGKRMTMKEVVRARFKYRVVADEFRSVAATVGVLPNQLQAMLWFTWKRINNVIYSPQLDAFAGYDNQWGTRIDPSRITPFPILAPGEVRLSPSVKKYLKEEQHGKDFQGDE